MSLRCREGDLARIIGRSKNPLVGDLYKGQLVDVLSKAAGVDRWNVKAIGFITVMGESEFSINDSDLDPLKGNPDTATHRAERAEV